MKSLRSLVSVSLVALVATLAGCGTDVAEQDVASAEQAVAQSAATDTVAAAATSNGKRPGKAGRGSLLQAALHEDIGLTVAQKQTLQALVPQRAERGMREGKSEPHAGADRGATLAAAIRSGNLDGLDARVAHDNRAMTAEMKAKRDEHRANEIKSLATLHATLTPEQRTALVAAVSKRGHGEKRGEARGEPGMKMLAGLELSDAQKEEIRTKLQAGKPSEADRAAFVAKAKEHAAERMAKLQTFAADSFDATAFMAPKARPEGDAKPAHRTRTNPLAVIVSVLNDAQREQLAARIEAGPKSRAL